MRRSRFVYFTSQLQLRGIANSKNGTANGGDILKRLDSKVVPTFVFNSVDIKMAAPRISTTHFFYQFLHFVNEFSEFVKFYRF